MCSGGLCSGEDAGGSNEDGSTVETKNQTGLKEILPEK